jgi:hypothetical protein
MMVHFVGKPGTVARIERQRNPGPLCPDIASLYPGYGLRLLPRAAHEGHGKDPSGAAGRGFLLAARLASGFASACGRPVR